MLHKDWEIITTGDTIVRRTFEWKPDTVARIQEAEDGSGQAFIDKTLLMADWIKKGEPKSVRETVVDTFQVIQIQSGVVTLARLIQNTERPGLQAILTESVNLRVEAATRDGSALVSETNKMDFDWEWKAPARGEARLTGGFTVTRANGDKEYDRCPTPTTRGVST